MTTTWPAGPRPASWLVTGASGLLGRALCAHLLASGDRVSAVRRTHPVPAGARDIRADLGSAFDPADWLADGDVTHVVHAAALADVDRCESDEEAARRLHVDATRCLARAAAAHRARFVFVSTDQLWGQLSGPAAEDLAPAPVNAYGRTKADAERAALAACPDALVVRTNFFGPGPPWRRSASDRVVDALSAGRTYHGFTDVFHTPIAVPLLCRLLVALLDAAASGIVHVGGGERVSKFEFARRVAAHVGLSPERVRPRSVRAAALTAPRPAEMSLRSGRAERLVLAPMPSLDHSLRAAYGRPARDPSRNEAQ